MDAGCYISVDTGCYISVDVVRLDRLQSPQTVHASCGRAETRAAPRAAPHAVVTGPTAARARLS